jgi:hypothetical protein
MGRSGLSYLEKTSQDVFGTTIDTPAALDRRTVKRFHANGAITIGDWVSLDVAQTHSARVITVIEAAAVAAGNPLVVGVAITTGVAGGFVDVVTRGYVEGASVANAVNASGLALVVDGTAAGQAVAIVAADIAPPCGVSLEAAAGNLADVFVYGLGSDS